MSSLETVQQELKLESVLIVPAAQNPLRLHVEGATPESRVAMVNIAAGMLNQNYGEPKFIVRDDEIKRGGPSYTIDTLKSLRKEQPKSDFYLIVGADLLPNFSQWKEYENILKVSNLCVTTRPGINLPFDISEMPDWLRPLIKNFKAGKGTLKSGKKIVYVKLQDVIVSSTEIRRRVRNKENVASYTPSPIAEYIAANKLYDGSTVKIGDFEAFTRFCASILDNKGALGISGYDVRSLQQPAEFTIAASGTSTRHAKALAEYIVKEVKEEFGAYPQSTEGMQEGRWIVVDYGALMIHLFYDFVRSEYRIEELWRDAQRIAFR
jgi:nicotinate-nucleotide adenylyltransferase